tara:strand:- start:120 stop:524 length:405 start_codon:yes stop_codon:yes gene_type:complete
MSSDALEIANLKARYCLAADTSTSDQAGAREMFGTLFTEDFVGDYGFGMLEGPEAIADFMVTAIGGGSEWMIHALGSPIIEIDGDSATGDWTIQVESRRREGAGLMTVVGRYSDIFRRTDKGWRIAGIKFTRFE